MMYYAKFLESKKLRLLLPALMAWATLSFSQNTTIDKSKGSPAPDRLYKVMIIPFEPKMYMSEVDKAFNEESKMNFSQIRNTFRKGMDMALWAEFKKNESTFTFFSDSAKYVKDLHFIYESIGYTFDPVNNPYAGVGEKNASGSKIKDGQVVVEVSYDAKFMNTKVNNPELLPYLNKKYGSELFVFINQVDIKRVEATYDPITDTYSREVAIHYTVLNAKGAFVNAGMVKKMFTSTENDPKKIAKQVLPVLAQTIRAKAESSLKK